MSALKGSRPARIVGAALKVGKHLYKFISYVYRFAVHVHWVTQPAFRMATTNAERASIVRFILKLLIARAAAVTDRIIQENLPQEDTMIRVRGVTYYVGLRSNETALFRELFEDHAYDRVEDFTPKDEWIVLDVGANIGIFSIQQALRGAHVFAFEPNPDCYRRLSKAIVANHLGDRIKAFECAIAETPGTGTLVVHGGFTPGATVERTDWQTFEQADIVQIRALDDIVPYLDVGHIDLLKIDTEGAEIGVLRGAAQTLDIVDRIILEHHSWDQLNEITVVIQESGFEPVLQLNEDPVAGRGVLYAKSGDRNRILSEKG